MAPVEKVERSALEVKLFKAGAWGILVFLVLFLAAVIFGPRAPGLMHTLGLEWLIPEEGGIYADCSKSYNKNNPYCNREHEERDEDWSGLSKKRGGSNPFTLSN